MTYVYLLMCNSLWP